MAQGPAAGLVLVEAILARGELHQYYLAHAAKADLCRRLGQTAPALSSYRQALTLTRQEPERRFLQHRIDEVLRRKSR
jgi:RNA polymerase sigma-70 factor (ECF subfamily)